MNRAAFYPRIPFLNNFSFYSEKTLYILLVEYILGNNFFSLLYKLYGILRHLLRVQTNYHKTDNIKNHLWDWEGGVEK